MPPSQQQSTRVGEVFTTQTQLSVSYPPFPASGNPADEEGCVTVTVCRVVHSNRGWRGRADLRSIRYIPLSQWETDPVGCLRAELASLVNPSAP